MVIYKNIGFILENCVTKKEKLIRGKMRNVIGGMVQEERHENTLLQVMDCGMIHGV